MILLYDERHKCKITLNAKTIIEAKNILRNETLQDEAENIIEESRDKNPREQIIVAFARGDKPNGIKHGQAVGWFQDQKTSAWMKRVYYLKKFPISLLPKIQEWCKPIDKSEDATNQERKYTITDFIPISRDIIKISEGSEGIVEKTTSIKNDTNQDLMTISSGSYTVGTGGDYATFDLAAADIAATLTGNLTLTQISAITQTTQSTFNTDLNSKTLTITSNKKTNGNFIDGWKLFDDFNDSITYFLIYNTCTGSGTFEISNLNIESINTNGYSLLKSRYNDVSEFIIKDCSMLKTGTSRGAPLHAYSSTVTAKFYNNVIKGYKYGITTQLCASSSIIENNTIDSIQNYAIQAYNQSATYKNNVTINTLSDNFYEISNATGKNNASSDATAADANWATGSGNKTNITPANEFESQNVADTNVYKIADTGVCYNGGTTVSILENTTGVRGNKRPHKPGVYSIGADEFKIPFLAGNLLYRKYW